MTGSERYPLIVRVMHWISALLILGLIGIGWYMAGLDRSVSYKFELYFWHKSFGVLALLLVITRIIIRLSSKVPALPDTMPKYEQVLGKLTHGVLYLFMLGIPLGGYLMSNAGGRDVPFFGLVMPSLIGENKELAGMLHQIHINAPYVLLAFITLHILAALKHCFFDKKEHDVLKRML